MLVFWLLFYVLESEDGISCLDTDPKCRALSITDSVVFFCSQLPNHLCPYTCGFCKPASVCGNGIVEIGESCDDGNRNGEDGCSENCQVETFYLCEGEVNLRAMKKKANKKSLSPFVVFSVIT